ncbi:hypothetical protein ACSSS7_005289 [Eimeria intestinalis]
MEERRIECRYEVPICELLPKLFFGEGCSEGLPHCNVSGSSAEQRPSFTLATEDGLLLDPQKSLLNCGLRPPQHRQEQQEIQGQHQKQSLLPLHSLPRQKLVSPESLGPPRLFLTPLPRPPPLRILVVQAKNGKADIVEINSWEKVSYLESWAENRFANFLRSSRGSSTINSISPILPGSNGKGFVLIFLGAPLRSTKTLKESGLRQHDTVYIHFSADAPPLPSLPARPEKASAGATAEA